MYMVEEYIAREKLADTVCRGKLACPA